MADILKHVCKGHLGPTKILRESQAKISKRSCLFAPFLYNYWQASYSPYFYYKHGLVGR